MCLIKLTVDRDTAIAIDANCKPDLRKNGVRGRAMKRWMAGLRAGDRLERGGAITDVHQNLGLLDRYPAELWLWRANEASFLHAPSPLMTGQFAVLKLSGCSPDMLHSLDEGVAQRAAGWGFKVLIMSDAYSTNMAGNTELLIEKSTQHIGVALDAWYKTAEGKGVAVAGTLTPTILLGGGGLENPCVSAKANESRGLLFFVASQLARHGSVLREHADFGALATSVTSAIRLLCAVYDILLGNGVVLEQTACASVLDMYVAHVTMHASYAPLVQKHHWCYEMLKHIPAKGNCRFNSCYPDETLNMVIARMAATVHPRRFAISVILKWRILSWIQEEAV